jgi:hypothetical protein
VEESLLREDGLPDIIKIRPVLYGPEIQSYYAVGEFLGKAFTVGKEI